MKTPDAADLWLLKVTLDSTAEALAELINTGYHQPDCAKAIDDSECTCGYNEAVMNCLIAAIGIRACRDTLKELGVETPQEEAGGGRHSGAGGTTGATLSEEVAEEAQTETYASPIQAPLGSRTEPSSPTTEGQSKTP